MTDADMITREISDKHVVHQRQDSTQELDALFSASLKPINDPVQSQSKWDNKKMPPSFYQEPKNRPHSRESSIDGGPGGMQGLGAMVPSPLQQQQAQQQQQPGGGAAPAGHYRAKSAPIPMNPTGRQIQRPSHQRTSSVDMIDERNSLDHMPLPPGWEKAFTPDGKPYFINHNTRETSWVDPRRKYLSQVRPMPTEIAPTIADILNGPMPDGWEKATGSNNELYFINHGSRTTSWYDPRLPQHLQLPGGRLRPNVDPNTFVQMTVGANSPGMPVAANSPGQQYMQGATSPMTPQHQRMPSGEPLTPTHQRMSSSGSPGEVNHRRMPSAEYQRQMQMQMEVQQQTMMIPDGSRSPGDPFIGSSGAVYAEGSAMHSKQESGDSGLGGMGNTFSLPGRSTAGNELIDEQMDDGQKRHHMINPGRSASAGMNQMNNNNNDMDTNDTDELVPSLSADIGNDLLNDVLSSGNKHMDLTWL